MEEKDRVLGMASGHSDDHATAVPVTTPLSTDMPEDAPASPHHPAAGVEQRPPTGDDGVVGREVVLTGLFSHQVAGHGVIVRAQAGKICKPLVPRELWFYRAFFHDTTGPSSPSATAPEVARRCCGSAVRRLRPFVPRWFGCLHVTKDQLLTVGAPPPPPSGAAVGAESSGREDRKQQKKREEDGGLRVTTWSEKVYHDLEEHLTAEPPGVIHRRRLSLLFLFLDTKYKYIKK